jgi:hypothetical protein
MNFHVAMSNKFLSCQVAVMLWICADSDAESIHGEAGVLDAHSEGECICVIDSVGTPLNITLHSLLVKVACELAAWWLSAVPPCPCLLNILFRSDL